MTDSPRSGTPAPVEELWRTIEGYCERKTGNRRPVRHIARRTGLGKSTVSDWFNYRSFPQFEAFQVFLSYFDDETWRRDLAIMWQAAWEAHQAARATSRPSEEHRAAHGDRRVTRPRRRWQPLAAVGAALIVIMTAAYVVVRVTDVAGQTSGVARPDGSTAPAVGIVGGTCMIVTARDIRVFTSAGGDEPWTTWPRNTTFWVDKDAGSPSRHRTTLRNGRHGWVTTDARYVQPSTDCK